MSEVIDAFLRAERGHQRAGKALCRSSRTAAAPSRKPIAPSASIGGDTKLLKTSSAAQELAAHRNALR
jgi:hypothetical protein